LNGLRILIAHNEYRTGGGEDAVVRADAALLASAGHEVTLFTRSNEQIDERGTYRRLKLGVATSWSRAAHREIGAIVRTERIDIAHFHNTLPLISPAAYYACAQAGVPVVQTLHNYRLLCPAATFYRDGAICEECTQHGLQQAVRHGCYRGSRPASAAVVAMLGVHRLCGTWQHRIDCYIALSDFARAKYIAGGLPEQRIRIRSNFVHPDPGERATPGDYALFVGRLTDEKGIRTLLAAYETGVLDLPLRIVGDGPLSGELAQRSAALPGAPVQLMGRLSPERTIEQMKGARFLVFPSQWYEALPMTLIEAAACGVPAVASALGAITEIVRDGHTGVLFEAGSADGLARAANWAWRNDAAVAAMGRRARRQFEEKYQAAHAYEQLHDIYRDVLAGRTRAA
jgi:glycosyltransferase involved in cell wall biosynthesis